MLAWLRRDGGQHAPAHMLTWIAQFSPAFLTVQSQDRTYPLDWNTNWFNHSIQVLISRVAVSIDCQCLVDQMRRTILPLRRLAFICPRKLKSMTGPAMPVRMPMEPKPILISMLRNKSTSRRARSAITILTSNTLKSSGGPPAQIPYWSPHKSIRKSTLSWRNICIRAAW